MNEQLKLLLVQANFVVGDIAGNTAKIIALCQSPEAQEADCVIFPELCLTGYPPEDLLLRSELHERVEQALLTLQTVNFLNTVIIGHPLQTDHGIANVASVIQGQTIIQQYRKQQLPNYGVFDEKRYFITGNEPKTITIKQFTIALAICEDLWWPESAQQAKEAAADLIVCLNASPFHVDKQAQRLQILQKRSQEVAIPIAYINLVGGQDELVFDGRSMLMNERGKVCALAKFGEEDRLSVTLNKQDNGIRISAPPLEPAMSQYEQIYKTLVIGTRDYVTKSGFHQAIIGLSGGIDSALTLAIAVDALGAENVQAVLMPSRYTAQMSIEDATKQADSMGVHHSTIPIDDCFQSFLNTLQTQFADLPVDATEENIQARCRGIILMALSNKTNRMVLTTGNKSEMAVGYATLYGDMAGGFAVLKDVPKTLVYALARWRDPEHKQIPERVLTRAPSAELAANQRDQDSLPPYEVLDPILKRYIEHDQSIDEIVQAGFDRQTVKQITSLVDRNEYKRRQAAPGVRISERAFGRDRRYPIASKF